MSNPNMDSNNLVGTLKKIICDKLKGINTQFKQEIFRNQSSHYLNTNHVQQVSLDRSDPKANIPSNLQKEHKKYHGDVDDPFLHITDSYRKTDKNHTEPTKDLIAINVSETTEKIRMNNPPSKKKLNSTFYTGTGYTDLHSRDTFLASTKQAGNIFRGSCINLQHNRDNTKDGTFFETMQQKDITSNQNLQKNKMPVLDSV